MHFPIGVQLEVDPTSVTQRRIKITCATSCSLGPTAYYLWYRNSKYLRYTYEAFINIDLASGSESEGTYQCAARPRLYGLKSSAVCKC